MKRTWTIIGVADVALSFKWYQTLLGLPATSPAHDYFGQILDTDGTVLLCLHQWGAHDHPPLSSPNHVPPGNGLLLFFRVDDFDEALLRARDLVAGLAEEPQWNRNTGTREFALRDPDGYYVMVSALQPSQSPEARQPGSHALAASDDDAGDPLIGVRVEPVMTTAKFSEVLDAYDMCSFGGGVVDTQAYISLERGTVHVVTGDPGLDEDVPEDIESGPYLALPDKAELGLGRELVMEFVEQHLPDERHTVSGFFSRRGAYGNFKDLLDRKDKLQAWFDFEESEKESRLREWCADNGIQLA